MKTDNTVLKTGIVAYYESAFNGLIPVKVLSVHNDVSRTPQLITFDLLKHGISSTWQAVVKVTAKRAGYHRGEVMTVHAHDVIPRGSVTKRKNYTLINNFTIEGD